MMIMIDFYFCFDRFWATPEAPEFFELEPPLRISEFSVIPSYKSEFLFIKFYKKNWDL